MLAPTITRRTEMACSRRLRGHARNEILPILKPSCRVVAITYDLTEKAGLFGGGQVVIRCGDGYAGGSDPRKDGQTVGF